MPKNKQTAKTPDLPKVKKSELRSITGMRDILPQDQKYWQLLRDAAENMANIYGYGRLDTPILEPTDLFVRGVGKQTDIVEKEMFSFVDQGGDNLSLRPEATASVVRSYIEHGMLNKPQPVKFFYMGPMFRHEKPQAGRYRQLWQIGFESIGESNPAMDAQIILVAYNILKEAHLDSIIQVNSIGCSDCRKKYKDELVAYYKPQVKMLCNSCKTRINKNPLRLLDCKDDDCQQLKDEAPQIVDYLCDDCKNHFMKVVEYLDELDLPYVLNPWIVRGLDYYSKTIFEYWDSDDVEGKNALGGGGRYDGLVKLLGGREETHACGVALGMDRIVSKMREKEIEVKEIYQPQIFIAQLGESAKRKAMSLFEKMRQQGHYRLSQAFYKDSLRAQLDMANKTKADITLIIGQKEINDKTIIVRDMESGVQEIVNFDKIEDDLKKRLSRIEKEKSSKFFEAENDEKENKTIQGGQN